MKVLCIGDVVADEGVEYLIKMLPRLKRQYTPDLIIVNGENSATYNGIDKYAYDSIISAGADVVTGGNHSFQRGDAENLHQNEKRLLAPANVPSMQSAKGKVVIDFTKTRVCVINLSGTLFVNGATNPFETVDTLLEKDCINIIDFHAEATSEKRALGFYVDGRASLVFGTHTHVQTNDAQLLQRGTGYITDIGMTGVKHSVLGKDKDIAVNNFKYPESRKPIQNAKGGCMLCGIYAEIDDFSKKCNLIKTVYIDN